MSTCFMYIESHCKIFKHRGISSIPNLLVKRNARDGEGYNRTVPVLVGLVTERNEAAALSSASQPAFVSPSSSSQYVVIASWY